MHLSIYADSVFIFYNKSLKKSSIIQLLSNVTALLYVCLLKQYDLGKGKGKANSHDTNELQVYQAY